MKRKKIEVKEPIEFRPIGDVDELIDELIALKKEMTKKGAENISIDYDIAFDCGILECYISYLRLETDKELEKRKKILEKKREKNKKEKMMIEERERKEYERLRKKFEG